MNVAELIERAQRLGIEIDYCPMRDKDSIAILYPCGSLCINCLITDEQWQKEILAHEIGHWVTGGFYTDTYDKTYKAKCEYRAMRKAVDLLVPYQDYKKALRSGVVELWELAEYFDVPEDVIKQAVSCYSRN
ncbi:MAG: ImmA/IrrE family metallo-endopeptidase [Chloroflexi bacterium]|nr:ImmA/IrrE family metallo-endopeptidase [Chloroflexota bacterium]